MLATGLAPSFGRWMPSAKAGRTAGSAERRVEVVGYRVAADDCVGDVSQVARNPRRVGEHAACRGGVEPGLELVAHLCAAQECFLERVVLGACEELVQAVDRADAGEQCLIGVGQVCEPADKQIV